MAISPDETVSQKQARLNRSTRSHWLHFAAHRARIRELILAGRELAPPGRLLALGAGNCNDLDLARLLDAFAEVHLLDLDPAALGAAAERQGVNHRPGLHLHAPIDLTGIAGIVSSWKRGKRSLADVREAVRVSETAPLPDWGARFDVVVSSCVLSQIAGYATDALGGERHPGFRDLVRAIRSRHLRTLVDSLVPGGTGLLACDLVSSDSLDDLTRFAEHELPGLLEKLARDGTFFSGLFPDALLAACRSDPALFGKVADPRLLPPWHWRLGPLRTFLVYGLRFRRAEGRAPLLIAPT